ncbi:hypothetical protein DPMN_170188 [Dreissena polymorpha]|uniref:FHA domain-containing protein n=1 Tax=Dreissena polymorpha TaxID=45954 RepID=A0A9D4IE23_DREPO|nr:hypothetical protein DPMN_170188 [Dreissena polymorpha]
MTDNEVNQNNNGLSMFHLRRIGQRASKAGVADTMDFYNVTYIIGRSVDKVDFVIDSNTYIQSACISRCHARIVRQAGNQHRLYDDSLNGVFVNNIKIEGSCVLREGDRVTFGHPTGMRIPAGSRVRQPDSEHQFMFEACRCGLHIQTVATDQTDIVKGGLEEEQKAEFKKPEVVVEAGSRSATSHYRVPRFQTETLTHDDMAFMEKEKESTHQSLLDQKAHTNHYDVERKTPEKNITDSAIAKETTDVYWNQSSKESWKDIKDNLEVDMEQIETEGMQQPTMRGNEFQPEQNIAAEIEGTFKNIIKDLSSICEKESGLKNAVHEKSPTKDAYIQTSQSCAMRQQSPVKDLEMQTCIEFEVAMNNYNEKVSVLKEKTAIATEMNISEYHTDSVGSDENTEDVCGDRTINYSPKPNSIENKSVAGKLCELEDRDSAAENKCIEEDNSDCAKGSIDSLVQTRQSVVESEQQGAKCVNGTATYVNNITGIIAKCLGNVAENEDTVAEEVSQNTDSIAENVSENDEHKGVGIKTEYIAKSKSCAKDIEDDVAVQNNASIRVAVHGGNGEVNTVLLTLNSESDGKEYTKEQIDMDVDAKLDIDVDSTKMDNNCEIENTEVSADDKFVVREANNTGVTTDCVLQSGGRVDVKKKTSIIGKGMDSENFDSQCIDAESSDNEKKTEGDYGASNDYDDAPVKIGAEEKCVEHVQSEAMTKASYILSDSVAYDDSDTNDEDYIDAIEKVEEDNVECDDVDNEIDHQSCSSYSKGVGVESDYGQCSAKYESNNEINSCFASEVSYENDDSEDNFYENDDGLESELAYIETDTDTAENDTTAKEAHVISTSFEVYNSAIESESDQGNIVVKELSTSFFGEIPDTNLIYRAGIGNSLNDTDISSLYETASLGESGMSSLINNDKSICCDEIGSIVSTNDEDICVEKMKENDKCKQNKAYEDCEKAIYENTVVKNNNVVDETNVDLQGRKRNMSSEIDESNGNEVTRKRRCKGDENDEHATVGTVDANRVAEKKQTTDVVKLALAKLKLQMKQVLKIKSSRHIDLTKQKDNETLDESESCTIRNYEKLHSETESNMERLVQNDLAVAREINHDHADCLGNDTKMLENKTKCLETVAKLDNIYNNLNQSNLNNKDKDFIMGEKEAQIGEDEARHNNLHDIAEVSDKKFTNNIELDIKKGIFESEDIGSEKSGFNDEENVVLADVKSDASSSVICVDKKSANCMNNDSFKNIEDMVTESCCFIDAGKMTLTDETNEPLDNDNKIGYAHDVAEIVNEVVGRDEMQENVNVIKPLNVKQNDLNIDEEKANEGLEGVDASVDEPETNSYTECLSTSWMNAKSRTASKTKDELEDTIMSPVIDHLGTSHPKSRQPQSSIIAEKGTSKSESISVTQSEDDARSVLSCQFSDDGDFGADIDFEHFDEDENHESAADKIIIDGGHSSDTVSLAFKDGDNQNMDLGSCSYEQAEILPLNTSTSMLVKKNKGVKRKCQFEDNPYAYTTPLNLSTENVCDVFKCPESVHKQSLGPSVLKDDGDSPGISGTQLIESSESADFRDLTMSQVFKVSHSLEAKANDTCMSGKKRSKAKDLLEKLRAKRQIKEEKVDNSETVNESSGGPVQGTSTDMDIYRRTELARTKANEMLSSIDNHVSSCRSLLDATKDMFTKTPALSTNPRVQAWGKELTDIEKKLIFPKTVIAVVGETGAGKSSLMNALLDHRSVLPTSGMRACTAVVVEVVQNTTSSSFEADIEFLQKKEWFDELEVLLKDLTALDGTIKKGVPDPASDAYSSYCKVRAVYGRVEPLSVLTRITTVTHQLGKVSVLKSHNADNFRRQVETYIETQEPGTGGQYWPIVKHVRLRLPHCDVCSSGAALVDLPGVRDSNAARDRIAKEYLKNCTAVWVVSSIHRAIDDKTAKDLLGENFRRQLLMDGQYGSIAFICTKTDVLMPSEIIRSLKLDKETRELETEIKALETEKVDLDLSVANGNLEAKRLQGTIKELETEVTELRNNLAEIRSLLDPVSQDSQQTEEVEALKEYEEEIHSKTTEIHESEGRIAGLKSQRQEAMQKTMLLEKRLVVLRKSIAAICANARNQYSQAQIRKDFKAGLREMKRRAGMTETDDPDEVDDVYDDNDDDDVGSSADNLRVFCCSATEYQKMSNLLTDDGPPQVFSTLEETQIPTLRNYVHEMTGIRQRQSMERLIHSVGRFVADILLYTSHDGKTCAKGNTFTKTVVDNELQKLDKALQPIVRNLSAVIVAIFDGSVRQKMEEGASNAASEAGNTCAKWGAPFVRDKTQDKRSGGLQFPTYRATVRRQGVFTSPSYGPVDFNEDLAEPMYRSMTIVWDRAFSGMLWRALDTSKTALMSELSRITASLGSQLGQLGVDSLRCARVATQLLFSANHKLSEIVSQLKDLVTSKQRDISRIVTPHVQTSLLGTYDMCASESGVGMFVRIKTYMSEGIERNRHSMFDQATEKLMQELLAVQQEVIEHVKQVCVSLLQDLRAAYEPLWEAPANSIQIRASFQKPISKIAKRMKRVYEEAGIESHDYPHADERLDLHGNHGNNQVSSTGMNGPGIMKDPEAGHNFLKQVKLESGQEPLFHGTEPQVKTEPVETMTTMSSVQTVSVKRESASSLTFGEQTLNDIQSGRLEVAPIEVAVSATAMSPTENIAAKHNRTFGVGPCNIATRKVMQSLLIGKKVMATVGQIGSSMAAGHQRPVVKAVVPSATVQGIVQVASLSGCNSIVQPQQGQVVSNAVISSGNCQSSGQYLLYTLSDGRKALTPFQVQPSQTPASFLQSSKLAVKSPAPYIPGTLSSSRNLVVPNLNSTQTGLSDKPSEQENQSTLCKFGIKPVAILPTAIQSQSAQTKPFIVNKSNTLLSQKNAPAVLEPALVTVKTDPVDNSCSGRIRRANKNFGFVDLTDDD